MWNSMKWAFNEMWFDEISLCRSEQFSQQGKSCNAINNYEVSNGTLKLLVKHEHYNGQNFTGATLATKVCFQDARLEIRAKKPTGAQLHAGLVMYAYKGVCGVGAFNGEVDIAKLRNQTNIWTSIHYAQYRSHDHVFDYHDDDLNEYHVYGVEWNSTRIAWFVDNQTIFETNRTHDQFGRSLSASENQFYLPFDHSFNILLHVGVGSFVGDNPLPELTDQDLQAWQSPHLEVDYIRVFDNKAVGSGLVWPIIVISVTSVLAICLVLTVIVVCSRNRKKKQDKMQMSELYDDNFNDDNNDQGDNTYADYNYNYVEDLRDREYLEVGHDEATWTLGSSSDRQLRS